MIFKTILLNITNWMDILEPQQVNYGFFRQPLQESIMEDIYVIIVSGRRLVSQLGGNLEI